MSDDDDVVVQDAPTLGTDETRVEYHQRLLKWTKDKRKEIERWLDAHEGET
jgi:hypothetical protein